jgi:predicted GNAT family N-acyltransferase
VAERRTNADGGTGNDAGAGPRSSASSRIELLTVGHDWERFGEVLELCYEVLYGPFGVERDAEWYHPAHGSEFCVAVSAEGRMLGTARLLPSPGEASRQVRQVVVVPEARLEGVGRALMAAVEETALAEGADDLWLHSRESAIGFYERLGYVCEGEPFISTLTGIPHRTMRKQLG